MFCLSAFPPFRLPGCGSPTARCFEGVCSPFFQGIPPNACSTVFVTRACNLAIRRLESIQARRAAAKQANRDAAAERKAREAAQEAADRMQRERNNVAVRSKGVEIRLRC